MLVSPMHCPSESSSIDAQPRTTRCPPPHQPQGSVGCEVLVHGTVACRLCSSTVQVRGRRGLAAEGWSGRAAVKWQR